MKTIIFNLLFAGFISGVALTGCSKSETVQDLNNNPQKISTTSQQTAKGGDDMNPGTTLLNQNHAIIYALDGGADITPQFNAYTFRFVGNEPAGEARVWNDRMTTQSGNWNMKAGIDFIISYPTNVFPELAFLNRTWTIGESSSAVIRLIASDGDEVHFSPK